MYDALHGFDLLSLDHVVYDLSRHPLHNFQEGWLHIFPLFNESYCSPPVLQTSARDVPDSCLAVPPSRCHIQFCFDP